jgi:hypothetical protein
MEIKKTIKSPILMMAVVLLASGSFYLIIKLCGYTYVHSNLSLIVMPLIIVLLTGKALENKNERTKIYVFFSTLLPLITVFHVISISVASDVETTFMYYIAYIFVLLLCSIILFFTYVKIRAIRIGLGIVYTILLISVLSILLLATLFSSSSVGSSSFVTRTIVRSELSPSSIYSAEIVDADAGATGGSTLVYVTRLNSDLNIYIGTLKKDPQMIYKGRWGDFETMTLRWEGDKILYINEKQYVVK